MNKENVLFQSFIIPAKKTLYPYLILASVLIMYAASVGAKEDDLIGIWWTDGNEAQITVSKSGDEFLGKLTWMKDPYKEGSDKVLKKDVNNPTESLRERNLLSVQLISGLTWDGEEYWEDGNIYDPETGKTYSCQAKFMEDKNTLELRGYIGFSLIGRSTTWTRVK